MYSEYEYLCVCVYSSVHTLHCNIAKNTVHLAFIHPVIGNINRVKVMELSLEHDG